MILYDKLFAILKENDISINELGLSSATAAKLKKNETVSLKVIVDICNLLHCQPGDIMENIGEINENSISYILKEEMEHKIKGGLYHQTQILMAYNSNHIEGNTLSEEQTRYIYETNSIGLENTVLKVDDIIETVNHFQAFDYIIEHSADLLTEKMIKDLHQILKNNTSDSRLKWFRTGDYKARENTVGGKETCGPDKVPKEMRRLISGYNQKVIKTIDDLIEFHFRFEAIHPFQDGNGRVGRLILFKECLRYNIVPFVIYDNKKLYYYRGLKEYENEKGFLRDTCLACQDEYVNLLKYFKIKYE